MILINLLPPELRKRKLQLQFNPMLAGLAACLLVVLGMLGGYLWLKQRNAAAEDLLTQRQTELADATRRAEEVKAMEKEIDRYKERRDYILSLLNRKMFWAKTFDDFATFLNQSFDGFQVCVQSVVVADQGQAGPARPAPAARGGARGAAAPEQVSYSLTWRYKIIGAELQMSGTYLNILLSTLNDSVFWQEFGFAGKPEDKYFGDRPKWNSDIERVIVEGDLNWLRVKQAEPVAAARPARPRTGGN